MAWSTPQYPGDSVRITRLRRKDEIGDVRIQVYTETAVRVATFLPGVSVCLEGDTPKTEPERSAWVVPRLADRLFDRYVSEARADGWLIYTTEK
jgi:hypothetical protein